MRAMAVVVAAVLVLAACGSDDNGGGDSSDSPLVPAIADELADDPDSPFTQEQADCAAASIVDGIGEDRLAELGVTAESAGEIEDIAFTDEELATIGQSITECAPDFLVQAFSSTGDFTEDEAQCLVDALPDDVVQDAIVGGLRDEEPSEDFAQAFLQAVLDCDIEITG